MDETCIKILIITDKVVDWSDKVRGEFKNVVREIRRRNFCQIYTGCFIFTIQSWLNESERVQAWSCAVLDKYISSDVENNVLRPSVKALIQKTQSYYKQMDGIKG